MNEYKKIIKVFVGIFFFNFIGLSLLAQQPTAQQPTAQQPTDIEVQNQKNKTLEQIAIESEMKWHNEDYRAYVSSLDDLTKLSKAFSRNKLRMALSNYQTGKSVISRMRKEIDRLNTESAEAKHFNEKWYWQTIDRKAREERIIGILKRRSKLKAVTYFTKTIYQLDEIQNRRIRESDEFEKLLSNTYIEWVLHQHDLGNLPQCVDILERYIALAPIYEREVAPHKYLASAYAFKEKILVKYKAGTEQEILFYKKKKNEHLLRAAELKYKKDSPEYETIVQLVNRDEVIAVAP